MPIYTGNGKCKLYIGNTKIRKGYLGTKIVYSCGNIVTYCVDTGVVYQEEIDEGASCLSPSSFSPTKSGWTFVGWKEDTQANGNVLSSKVMGDEPITLYACYSRTVTLSYNANGGTGSMEPQSGTAYYNSGNTLNPEFTLKANTFNRDEYTFTSWALGSGYGSRYAAGTKLTLSENKTMYAVWESDVPSSIITSIKASGDPSDSPNTLYNFYYTSVNLTSVNSVTFTVNYYYYDSNSNEVPGIPEDDKVKKYFYNAYKAIVGISSWSQSSFDRFDEYIYGNYTYDITQSGSITMTVNVSGLSGNYYLGVGVQGYNSYTNGQLYHPEFQDYYAEITQIDFN